jgi:SEC-C motif-containing protein
MNACPCGSGQNLALCCGRYFDSLAAPTAVALMRSRYSAHVLGKTRYLADTLSVAQRADFDIAELESVFGQTEWLGLEIRVVAGGGEADQTGTVEFVARRRDKSGPGIHHERASFIREDGRWVFDDCVMDPKAATRRVVKIGRNDPCPCGSGKKYKKCCGA